MSPSSPAFAIRPREDQFVADLANLFRRHRTRIGSPAYLAVLAPALQANSALRSDLLMLCNAISRMAESDLAPDELLQLVAKAVSGAGPVDRELSIPAELRETFISGWEEWQARAESLSAMYWGELGPEPDNAAPYAADGASGNPPRWTTSAQKTEASDITPETRIGELTISQLRTYLDQIEARVGRLQPYLPHPPGHLSHSGVHTIPEPGDSSSGHDEEGLSSPPAPLPEEAHEAQPETASPLLKATPAVHEPEPKEATGRFTPRTSSKGNGGILRLALRDVPGEEQAELTRPEEPVMFRSVAESRGGLGRGIFWGVAALTLLAPAAYFGSGYLYPKPATMPLAPPRAPGLPPQELPPAPTPRPAAGVIPSPTVRPTPRLLPKEVHMEAQAARAEQR